MGMKCSAWSPSPTPPGQTVDFLTINHLFFHSISVLSCLFYCWHVSLFLNIILYLKTEPSTFPGERRVVGQEAMAWDSSASLPEVATREAEPLGELSNICVPRSSAGALWALEPGQICALPTLGVQFLTDGKEKAAWVIQWYFCG